MTNYNGINSSLQKNKNRALALRMIATKHPISRIDISKSIGLSKMAVTNIVGELITDGYVIEKEINDNLMVGRNPVSLDISKNAPKVVSVYLSRMNFTVIISDMKLNILYRSTYSLANETNESLTDKLFTAFDEAFEYKNKNFPNNRVPAIGVSSIGPLDSINGVILNPRNFYKIDNFPISEILSKRYELPVFLNNDMNAAAVAENLYGYGNQYSDFVYLGLTAGVGAGIVSQGVLYQNRSGFTGEIGHMSVNYNGILCSCGNRGCLEAYTSIPVILRRLQEVTGNMEIECSDFDRLAEDKRCHEVFSDIAMKISITLVNVANLLDPQCIIIGHEGYYLPAKYIEEIAAYVNSHILAAKHRTIKFTPSSFGVDAPLKGSACCVWQEIYDGNLYA